MTSLKPHKGVTNGKQLLQSGMPQQQQEEEVSDGQLGTVGGTELGGGRSVQDYQNLEGNRGLGGAKHVI